MKNIFVIFQAFSLLAASFAIAKDVSYISVEQVCKPPYVLEAIKRNDPLFVDDFLTLHSLLRMASPISVFEIGTCTGEGTLIIKNAVIDSEVYSLELPLGGSSYDIQIIGKACYLPYHQIIGNSLSVDYSKYYPLDAWFIDGAHEYLYVLYESKQALLSTPKLIVWHDADIPEVLMAIQEALDNTDYLLFRVNNTRIAFSIPSTSHIIELIYD